jgi:DNA-binding IclR family transcriptional regulator
VVWELMERDRAAGSIAADQEFEHEVVELAVPVRDPAGGITAALSVLGIRAELGSGAAAAAVALHGAAERLRASPAAG